MGSDVVGISGGGKIDAIGVVLGEGAIVAGAGSGVVSLVFSAEVDGVDGVSLFVRSDVVVGVVGRVVVSPFFGIEWMSLDDMRRFCRDTIVGVTNRRVVVEGIHVDSMHIIDVVFICRHGVVIGVAGGDCGARFKLVFGSLVNSCEKCNLEVI